MSDLYLTTAIPFVNARPHLGFALELCIADALARHARARGTRVHFVTGSDDHSLKNVLAAERAGVPTAQFVDDNSAHFLQLSAALGISHDAFISTSRAPNHRACVHELWRRCAERGELFRRSYSGLYCVGCERFCEPGETSCSEHAAPLEHVSEDNWFFRLSRYTDVLREEIEQKRLRITPESARTETLAILREPLPDLCVSRSAQRARGWGVPVPGDPEQVIWVWFDALAYYLTALGFGGSGATLFDRLWGATSTPVESELNRQGAIRRQENLSDSSSWRPLASAGDVGLVRRVHVIGKGVTRFHALIWPAILSATGLRWPDELLVHGYLTQGGAKISKSGSALDPSPLIAAYGADAVRYFLLRHVRTTRDGDFERERFAQAYNAELANGLGNLLSRLLGLLQRANGGVIPAAGDEPPELRELKRHVQSLPAGVDRAVERYALDDALAAIFTRVDACNRSIDQVAPWALIKRGETSLACAWLRGWLEALFGIGNSLSAFLPHTATQLLAALGETTTASHGCLREGQPLPASCQLFPRIDAF